MAHDNKTLEELGRHNTARFFTENRHVSWVLLIAVIVWGIYGYLNIPQRKDPEIPVRLAVAITPWPGVDALKIEELVTQAVERTAAESKAIHPASDRSFGLKSVTLPGVSIVQIQLDESIDDTEKAFNDINLKLNSLNDQLPQGAGPIQFNSNFGDTAALLLTVASPKESDVEISLRARDIRKVLEAERGQLPAAQAEARAALIVAFPRTVNPRAAERGLRALLDAVRAKGFGHDLQLLQGSGFIGLDGHFDGDDKAIRDFVRSFVHDRLGELRFHPDAWPPIIVRDPQQTEAELRAVGGDKYSYRELDHFTTLIEKNLENVTLVSTVSRSGVLDEEITLVYSQERLASYGLQPSKIKEILNARNTSIPGGLVDARGVNVPIEPSGEFTETSQIGDVLIATSSAGSPVYLRSVVDTVRGYQSPPRFLNYQSWRDAEGKWQRSRAISLAVDMRSGGQIAKFGAGVDTALEGVKPHLPEDILLFKTSNQPAQVHDSVDLFMTALYEAIALVVLVSLLGFWEWRSAVLMMVSMPITLAMTFGMIFFIGIELQQVSIATLIIALGLLVDDPVVAGDAIKRELAAGKARIVAAWLGPTKLAKAILFATITNVVAYMPFLLLSGNTGSFLQSLPIVMACALIASRLVSMTFVPLIGYWMLRPRKRPVLSIEERRTRGFAGFYYRVGGWAIRHRHLVFLGSLAILVLGGYLKSQLPNAFFPVDVQRLFYVDVWLPNDASVPHTNEVSAEVERIMTDVAADYAKAEASTNGAAGEVVQAITTFVGGGAPRFWFSVTPQKQQSNYAQVLVRLADKEDTPHLVPRLQEALSASVPGAIIDVRQLQTNPVQHPIAIRISGRATVDSAGADKEIATLRRLSDEVVAILAEIPYASRVRGDWGEESFRARLVIDPDRANLAGVTNQDVAGSSLSGFSGLQVTSLRDGDKEIPVVTRLQLPQRSVLSDLNNLYVYSESNDNKVPLQEIASIDYELATERIRREDHFRTVTVIGYPVAGGLPSQVTDRAAAGLAAFRERLPPGYEMVIAGEFAKTKHGFTQLLIIMAMSTALIYLALVVQFKNAVKPIIVLLAVPYGITGALAGLYLSGSPFGFMGFLGIVALIGVIVSHIIVLFDFIEEMSDKGEPLEQALLDAGIVRLRPVMITIGATVTALVPLAVHGGPLWQPLCFAQIGGLLVATFVTLLLVPVVFSIFVLDLKLVKWPAHDAAAATPQSA
jgi:multidrug efflux pump subunit AcrB